MEGNKEIKQKNKKWEIMWRLKWRKIYKKRYVPSYEISHVLSWAKIYSIMMNKKFALEKAGLEI